MKGEGEGEEEEKGGEKVWMRERMRDIERMTKRENERGRE